MKQQVKTNDASADGILSPAIISNGFVFVSGQIHADPDLTLVGNTPGEKLIKAMENVRSVLEFAGATLDDIVKVVIYVTDMAMMPDINETYPTFFSDPLPVREAVCVSALPLGASIEISVIAEQRQ